MLTMLIEFTSVVTFIMVISVGGERFYKLGKISRLNVIYVIGFKEYKVYSV